MLQSSSFYFVQYASLGSLKYDESVPYCHKLIFSQTPVRRCPAINAAPIHGPFVIIAGETPPVLDEDSGALPAADETEDEAESLLPSIVETPLGQSGVGMMMLTTRARQVDWAAETVDSSEVDQSPTSVTHAWYGEDSVAGMALVRPSQLENTPLWALL